MPALNSEGEIRAAGGVVVRCSSDAQEILIVHRPRYDDWSLPKGKAKRRETDEEAARREVAEETGVDARIVAELGAVHYRDRNRERKVARFWLMEAASDGLAPRGDEVDDVRWVRLHDAIAILSRLAEAEFLEALATDGAICPGELGLHVYSADYESDNPDEVRIYDVKRREAR